MFGVTGALFIKGSGTNCRIISEVVFSIIDGEGKFFGCCEKEKLVEKLLFLCQDFY